MNKNIVIIHYNTPYLTECLVRSINLFVKDAKIYIFDNSDKDSFTAEFDNVIKLDNTKGQYIDFNKWLENYPDRSKSYGKTNGWASAKHCYSVEKCIEIIDEPFILLDSDVLLKKDISDLYDDNVIYVAEVIVQKRFSVNRVLPFICYINVPMCKKNNIHFFDENYMYGLYKSLNSEKYDTGAGFYLNTKEFNHKEIKNNDYIVHYKAGSWVNDAKKYHNYKQISIKEWVMKYRKYWDTTKNKNVVYTCITGGYDGLLEPLYHTEGFDYICFTDNTELKSDIWEIRPLPKETEGLSQVKKQRHVKINAHKVLNEYELSVWVDGNVDLKGDLNEFVSNSIEDGISVYVPQHPRRNCIYEEAKAVISMKKDKKEIVEPQIERYRKEKFPSKYGLLQSNILLRKHNNSDCIKLMEAWFDELKDNSHRDQLSFNYALWKNSDIKIKYLDKFIYKSKYFFWNGGHRKTVRRSPSPSLNKILERKKIKNGKTVEEIKSDFSKLLLKNRQNFSKYTLNGY